ncbi:Transposase [Candidatus Regiella insecticola 5.15]|uniref:Transposase n=2 Tax=Candidatus Regiella insecticola TaxID=138073 RepID=G2GZW4_9ENTR|nr:Transposase [Candidatus Regiella insecticola 5.15]
MGDYIGIDVGKVTLDVCFSDKVTPLSNSPSLIKKGVQEIKKNRDVELVLCEATGGYERTLVKALRAQQIPVFVEHANKIRAFAKSKGLLAKTDRIDAQLIKDYASTMKPTS